MRIPQSSGLLFAVLLQPFAAGAADVFVACQTGNDLSTGATPATALRTIQTAVSRAAGGDTVRVLAGVCDASNQPPFPVLMKDGVSVVGAGQSATFVVGVNGNPLFRFADLGAVYPPSQVLSDFDLASDADVIYIIRGAPTIRANFLHGANLRTGNVGINIEALDAALGVDSLIEGNTFRELFQGVRVKAIAATSRPAVRRNWFLGSASFAQNAVHAERKDGINVELTIENNVVAHTYAGIEMLGGTHTVRHNTITANSTGISFDTSLSPIVAAGLDNNILAFNDDGIAESRGLGTTISAFRNNVFFGNRGADYRDQNGIPVADVNSLPNASGNLQAGTAVDPAFVNAAGNDYHIQPASGVRNRGLPAAAPVDDIDGDARSDGLPDIGADEVRGGTTTGLNLFRSTVTAVAAGWKVLHFPHAPPLLVDPGWPRPVVAPGTSDDSGILGVAEPLVLYWILDASNQPVSIILRAAKIPGTSDLRVSF